MDSVNKYLGEAKISKLIFKFSIPCIMGLLISALYNIVDQIFIGNSELGYYGNAATGVSFPIICIANAFAWCLGDGLAKITQIKVNITLIIIVEIIPVPTLLCALSVSFLPEQILK